MEGIYIPEGYKSPRSIKETEQQIKTVKDFFEVALAESLNHTKVSAPLFVYPESGLNDNLNGVERPVTFGIKEHGDKEVEIVHSLAKWKRYALKKYGFRHGMGLYTDMTAIRRDEDTDNLHSIYVDQWDWEKVIDKSERTIDVLKCTVKDIYGAIEQSEDYFCNCFKEINRILPEEITFVTTQELEDRWPDATKQEREDRIAAECGAVFLMKIGGELKSGKPHDGRAPDYDDWELNGDIIVNFPVLNRSLELSSMGIRVDEEALMRQLKIAGCEERANLPFHKDLLNGELPYTIGGGIGQSRICMYFLRRAHIGEVQSSIWKDGVVEYAAEHGVNLL